MTIFEYVDISNLSKDEVRKIILEKEQFYIDLLIPSYNINPKANSRLGSRHSEDSKELMRINNHGDNHPMFGKKHHPETIIKNRIANSGENNPMFGKNHKLETLEKLSLARIGKPTTLRL